MAENTLTVPQVTLKFQAGCQTLCVSRRQRVLLVVRA